ncbi:NADH-quinone oxidoreductase subunit G [Lichenicola cladoniae]|uniref:NADH-quinone oxidoreductase n=1 Tax=Lichenicola cladoniae TaxID=1484109 RepID=A0A6M8HQ94_9PROT|nr:NADH-quinone oxidoreductase subunit NuoG [Lichenicola cladoniae]NPD67921.1 NADH-quinone oxidoreductase subunit G [Acetobacteraceae bacterium]QKE90518.1 NADH-quinone oxidoreductase subunit G [Lichenicola cladoniae]
MARVTVDGIQVEVANGSSVLQACEAAGKEIPRFCYHERLSIAGNCRMCLVEIEKAPKPVASCGYPVADGMVVKTDTEVVRRARRAVMEFLLINHPLDCPICDQGGECDLQDQAYSYGADHSRYAENKRAVQDKYLGPLVKTVMTRCIQCTRCIRFASEVAGVPELGATSRGENMEITTYVEKALTSELSGNLIDICPVGALTSKPYAFVARPWELKKTDSIDVMDATGVNIRIHARGPEVLRILPRTNDEVNEEWMADKGRFSFDGFKRRRLDRPWVRVHGKLHPASWQDAFVSIARRLEGVKGERIGAIAGDLCDAESMVALKDLMTALGSNNLDCRQDGAQYDVSRREFYTFNTGIVGIEEADALLLIGTNPRLEAPVINARIRKRWLAGNFPIGVIGAAGPDLTYDATMLGDRPSVLAGLLDGAIEFAEVLKNAKRPMIVVGQAALTRDDAGAVLAAVWTLAEQVGALKADWHGFNVLHHAAARVAALDLGFVPKSGSRSVAGMMSGGVEVLWLLGADEIGPARIGPDTFVIYQGHHGDAGAARADVILPGATYAEKSGTYVNTEGRVQRAFQAIFPPGEAREDWRILRAFSEVVGHKLPYDDIEGVRRRLAEVNPVFARQGLPRFGAVQLAGPAGDATAIGSAPFGSVIHDYYQTNAISRASPTMAECSRVYVHPVVQAAE